MHYNCKCYLEFREPKEEKEVPFQIEVPKFEGDIDEAWEAFYRILDDPDSVFELSSDVEDFLGNG